MTISEKIFEELEKKEMSQKEFAKLTGIAPSTISDWKRKKTNPVAEKIMIICKTLDITPQELLSGSDGEGKRSKEADYLVIGKGTDLGMFVEAYQKLPPAKKNRLVGYMAAMTDYLDK